MCIYHLNGSINIIKNDSQFKYKGGVGMADRDNPNNFRKLTDYHLVEKDFIEFKKNKLYETVPELYSELKNLYAKSTIYKKIKNYDNKKHIEMFTGYDFKYDPKELFRVYKENFEKMHIINLHRPFSDWLNSLYSQHFHSKKLFNLIHSFRVDKLRIKYDNYESFVSNIPGMHIQFDDIFLPNTHNIISSIAESINQPSPAINWGKEKYDLYSALRSYDKTFNQFDKNKVYLSNYTKKVISKYFNQKSTNLLQNIFTTILYLLDVFIYKIKIKLK